MTVKHNKIASRRCKIEYPAFCAEEGDADVSLMNLFSEKLLTLTEELAGSCRDKKTVLTYNINDKDGRTDITFTVSQTEGRSVVMSRRLDVFWKNGVIRKFKIYGK